VASRQGGRLLRGRQSVMSMGSSESEFETDSGTRRIRHWMAARRDAEMWMQLHESVVVPEFPRVGHWWHDPVHLDHYHRRPIDQAIIRSDSSNHSSMPELAFPEVLPPLVQPGVLPGILPGVLPDLGLGDFDTDSADSADSTVIPADSVSDYSADSAASAYSADSDEEAVAADADDAGAAPSTGLATTAHVVPFVSVDWNVDGPVLPVPVFSNENLGQCAYGNHRVQQAFP
jgi:hypothetical protein